ncbi:Ribosome biogenesis protein 1 [Desmophyllum pertusum]|uniref:Ribosome biogenesis protein 1 n=1 Tax=Desmophyllum pertusum TaxID=174260 RepID=A0A9X0D2X0_9CNID|nr:Ribosome biogenesis protein 1 [Desmophyllum pertusum]
MKIMNKIRKKREKVAVSLPIMVRKKKKKRATTNKETEKDDTEQNNNQGEIKKLTETFDEDNTSDEEDARNTIGNIPVEWYNEYPHIGYNLDGKRILKPATADELDQFLSKMDDPNYWRKSTRQGNHERSCSYQ